MLPNPIIDVSDVNTIAFVVLADIRYLVLC